MIKIRWWAHWDSMWTKKGTAEIWGPFIDAEGELWHRLAKSYGLMEQ